MMYLSWLCMKMLEFTAGITMVFVVRYSIVYAEMGIIVIENYNYNYNYVIKNCN